jgi:prepilin-type N-terminal cleavage/methylation domain-containing protein
MSKQRSGFTLIELMVVIAMMAIMVAVATPRIRSLRDRSNLRAARDEVATAFALARSAAVQKGITANIKMRNDSVWVSTSTGQRILPVRYLKDLYGATLNPAVADTFIEFDARGFAIGRATKTEYPVSVGSLSATVCISKLGLVTKVGCVQ